MKKYIIYIGLVAIGLLLGYFFFGRTHKHKINEEKSTETLVSQSIWTCSMHPQVRQDEPGDCPICGMDLIPLDENASSNPLAFEMTDEAVKLANIQTTLIGASQLKGGKELSLNGKIQADETRSASIVAHIPGRIEKLFVSFVGDRIYKGQKIATIYSPDLITAQKELLEAKKIVDISPALLDAAKNKLRYWKIENSTIENLLQTGKVQEYFNIYAGYSGIVTNKKVTVGDYLSTGEVLFDVQNLSRLWVVLDVYEEDLPNIKEGSIVHFQTPSVPSKIFKAAINFVDPVINPATRTASIRAEINNVSRQLKPEMFVTGTLSGIESKSQTLTVPKTAVLWTGERSVVYVKLPDTRLPSYEYREVELGKSLGSNYVIEEGLDPGDEVVTNGAFVIDAAAQLNNQASMMNRNVMTSKIDHSKHLPDYTKRTPLAFKQQLVKIMEKYISLKDALVLSDSRKAALLAKELLLSIHAADMSLLKGDAHIYWMKQLKALDAHGEKISALTAVEEQRKQFDFLSQAITKSIKVFGISGNTYYVQHCPMANENNGADWLSKELEIRNPYFGDKMLTCGFVKDTITKDYKNKQIEKNLNNLKKIHRH